MYSMVALSLDAGANAPGNLAASHVTLSLSGYRSVGGDGFVGWPSSHVMQCSTMGGNSCPFDLPNGFRTRAVRFSANDWRSDRSAQKPDATSLLFRSARVKHHSQQQRSPDRSTAAIKSVQLAAGLDFVPVSTGAFRWKMFLFIPVSVWYLPITRPCFLENG